ncbi:uncharacterized protein DNG_03378 [Cephalotrichum gorgonifer]|uniref:Uncharacterized protein n=1 Tax=Cephalotrichum gorgonifer TaxID=2041049 RepID=A0AAE8SU80_9PEZI|nr:uncharacterized protein DNG_03378 [Cephalotrichum gorgonifer]
MAPAKTNFKTFEVQARLLRAIVAAHPEVKWNYKEIQKCFGSDLTDNILGHRMRHIRTQSAIIRRGLDAGLDPKDMPAADNLFPKDQNKIDPDICKYFGDSTPDGIQFQFRSIKKDAQALKAASDSGEDPSTAVSFTAGTPSKRTPAKSTPGTTPATARSTGGRKRKASIKYEASEDEVLEEVNYNERDATPTPNPRPLKRARDAPVDLTASESEESATTPSDYALTASTTMEDTKPPTQSQSTQSQSFYEDSFGSGYSMENLVDPEDMHAFYTLGEI